MEEEVENKYLTKKILLFIPYFYVFFCFCLFVVTAIVVSSPLISISVFVMYGARYITARSRLASSSSSSFKGV